MQFGWPGIHAVRWLSAASNHMTLIKKLRDQTGAPIGDVKSALQEADWDIGEAQSQRVEPLLGLFHSGAYTFIILYRISHVMSAEKAGQGLRKKGLAAASKKSSRHTAEGLIGLVRSNTAVAAVEINSETDFVARNEQFRNLVSFAASSVLSHTPTVFQLATDSSYEIDHDSLLNSPVDESNRTLGAAVAHVAGSVRENIRLRRAFHVAASSSDHGVLGSYVHATVAPGLGRIAGIVLLRHEGGSLASNSLQRTQNIANKLAMHVVGAMPKYLDRSAVPEAALAAERELLREQAAASGKPAAILEKIVEGRLAKFYEEVCLLEQPYIMEEKKNVSQVLAECEVPGLAISTFLRIQVGEGLENVSESKKSFAEEVAVTLEQTSL